MGAGRVGRRRVEGGCSEQSASKDWTGVCGRPNAQAARIAGGGPVRRCGGTRACTTRKSS
eukprot:6773212-Prymnesium_polylepis.1